MNTVLNRLKEIATAVMYAAEGDTLNQVLERIADVSRELVQARYAALGVPDGNGRLRYFEYSGISQEQAQAIGDPPVGHGLLGVIMSERHSVRLERMSDHPRTYGFPPNHPPMKSLLGVPIQLGDQLYGMLYLSDRIDGQPFTDEDQVLIETMAGYAALAIAGSQLRQRESRLALLEERERIGMELHDGIIQSLYAIGMHIELIRTDGDHRYQELDRVVDSLNDVIEDIRRYILNLKARNYNQKTANECLRDVVTRLHLPPTLRVEIDAPDTVMPFSPTTYEAICQMANEAVSNVARHANATQLRLTAQQVDHRFEVRIVDNGIGFDLDNMRHASGLGLRNIQQRAQLHGGTVNIQTAPNHGTCVVIRVPILGAQ